MDDGRWGNIHHLGQRNILKCWIQPLGIYPMFISSYFWISSLCVGTLIPQQVDGKIGNSSLSYLRLLFVLVPFLNWCYSIWWNNFILLFNWLFLNIHHMPQTIFASEFQTILIQYTIPNKTYIKNYLPDWKYLFKNITGLPLRWWYTLIRLVHLLSKYIARKAQILGPMSYDAYSYCCCFVGM